MAVESGQSKAGTAGVDPQIASTLAPFCAPGLVRSPFQNPDWIAAYAETLGRDAPLDVLTAIDGEALLRLPVLKRKWGSFTVADIAGGKHASLHAPAFDGEFSRDPSHFIPSLQQAGHAANIDALLLTDCPADIDGVPNPLMALKHQRSPSDAHQIALSPDGEALINRLLDRDDRKKLRQKEKKLTDMLGPVRAGFLHQPAEIAATLKALHAWKALRFGAKGIDDPFASEEARRFLTIATAGEAPPIRLFALHAGERLIALMAGADSTARFSGMANANDPDPDIMRISPGDLLIRHLIPTVAAEGKRFFDLGVGEARYKKRWCPDVLSLFDCTISFSAKGHVAARAFLAMRAAKRFIKRNEIAMALLGRMRSLKA